jgi:hypothetical protein
MATHDTPLAVSLSRPHARVPVGAASEISRYRHLEARAERRDDDVRANTPDA